MTKQDYIDVQLTLAEAKAVARLIAVGAANIRSDSDPVSNEITLHRAVAAAERGAEKIQIAMLTVGKPLD
ncbi:MAG: hypothetical protein HQL77_16085 [Magnetococcales bacterium]|nr:hypothetical protein [Magnetococcales bacterium]MBF0436872.1 hypothetical protein [Magnetococcales bacterium]